MEILERTVETPIQLGLCCINTVLRNQTPTVFCSRKMMMKSVKEKGIEELKKLILLNIIDISKMMIWNENNGIRVMRLSSELFPHKSNPGIEDYSFDFAKKKLIIVGKIAKRLNHRLTFHPGQYNVIGTPSEKAFQHTIDDLKTHADILDLMGLDENSVMVIHGGGVYGDKKTTKERWYKQFKMLPGNVQKRLVLENCEKCYSIEDCLEMSEKTNIPVVFDTHHYDCYLKLHPDEKLNKPDYYIPLILNTWKKRGIKPKFHISEQGSGKIGHHSDYIENIPDYLLEIPDKYGVNIDIMIEAKMKEQAILKLYSKYNFLSCKNDKTKTNK